MSDHDELRITEELLEEWEDELGDGEGAEAEAPPLPDPTRAARQPGDGTPTRPAPARAVASRPPAPPRPPQSSAEIPAPQATRARGWREPSTPFALEIPSPPLEDFDADSAEAALERMTLDSLDAIATPPKTDSDVAALFADEGETDRLLDALMPPDVGEQKLPGQNFPDEAATTLHPAALPAEEAPPTEEVEHEHDEHEHDEHEHDEHEHEQGDDLGRMARELELPFALEHVEPKAVAAGSPRARTLSLEPDLDDPLEELLASAAEEPAFELLVEPGFEDEDAALDQLIAIEDDDEDLVPVAPKGSFFPDESTTEVAPTSSLPPEPKRGGHFEDTTASGTIMLPDTDGMDTLEESLSETFAESPSGTFEVLDDELVDDSQGARSLPPPLAPRGSRVPRAAEGAANLVDDVAAQPRERGPDRGADAAQRTVRYKKRRTEHFPLVGQSAEAQRARRDLLTELADAASATARARLLCAAAELSEQLGEVDEARALYEAAHAADPTDLTVVRALRRDATARGAIGEVGEYLRAECELPLSTTDRVSALCALAELCLGPLATPDEAARAARRASAEDPRSVAAALLLLEAASRQDDEAGVRDALATLAAAWSDPAAQCAIRAYLARLLEREDRIEEAQVQYASAAQASTGCVRAFVGRARTELALGRSEQAAASLVRCAEMFRQPPAADAFRRAAALVLWHRTDEPKLALAELEPCSSALALRLRTQAAEAAGASDIEREAAVRWAEAAHDEERALALVWLSELRANDGDFESAETALREASLASPSLGTIRVMRELLARKIGDPERLAMVLESGGAEASGALTAAAKLAPDPRRFEQELELLVEAYERSELPVCSDALLLDAGAGGDNLLIVSESLGRIVESREPERRVGPLLALAWFGRVHDRPDTVEAALAQAHSTVEDTVARRAWAEHLRTTSPTEAAALWQDEARVTLGDRAAFASMMAARLHADYDAQTASLESALAAEPGYSPAAWALESLARGNGDVELLKEVNVALADASRGPREHAGRFLRAALAHSAEDPGGAAQLLMRARQAAPKDAILQALSLRLRDSVSPAERAELMLQSALASRGLDGEALSVRAALAFEEAGDDDRARRLYAERVDRPGLIGRVARRGLDRVELRDDAGRAILDRLTQTKDSEQDEPRRIPILLEIADRALLDLGDYEASMRAHREVLEYRPNHPLSLLALELDAFLSRDDDQLLDVTLRLVRSLDHPSDVADRLRLAVRLLRAKKDADPRAVEALLVEQAERATLDPWLARRVEAAARATHRRELGVQALSALLDWVGRSNDRQLIAMRLAELLEADGAHRAAATALATVVPSTGAHPLAPELLGRLYEIALDYDLAAGAYAYAAELAKVPLRSAELYYRAGILFQDEIADDRRARNSLTAAADIDASYLDVYERLERILVADDDARELSRLTEAKLRAGAGPVELVDLHVKLATLRERMGDHDGARAALRAALAIQGERLDALHKLAELCIADEDYKGAAEALIRIARLRKAPEELRWVFFQLGDIYERHLPDEKRAEAAFARALALVPSDTESMERLATLYERQGRIDKSVDVLQRLLGVAGDDVEGERDRRLRLAAVYERAGELRRAEETLEEARKRTPVDLGVIKLQAEFYKRQNAQSALAMHLNRAANDFRQRLDADIGDGSAWHGLVEILGLRGRQDAARSTASAAAALGIVDVKLAQRLDAEGGVPGARRAAADASLDELLAPGSLSQVARTVFRLAEESFDRALPFDFRTAHAERLSPRDADYRRLSDAVAHWYAPTDLTLYVTDARPRACIPVTSLPPTFVIGRELVRGLDERQLGFLAVRMAKCAAAQLAVPARTSREQLALLLFGLVHVFDPGFAPPDDVDAALLGQMARRIAKSLPKKHRDELHALSIELVGSREFDAAALGRATVEFTNRIALLATGSVPSALTTLLALTGESMPAHATDRVRLLARNDAVSALLRFAASDTYFDARHRTGADR